MTDLNKLADALDLYNAGDEFQRPIEEAAALLRAAAGADVDDLMALFEDLAVEAGKSAIYVAQGGPEISPEHSVLRQRYNRVADDLEARLRLLVAQVPRWLPIEEAPKDGRTLLLGRFNALKKWRTMRGQWYSADLIAEEWEEPDDQPEGWYETAVEPDPPNCWFIEPTHFQYLPPAPKEPV